MNRGFINIGIAIAVMVVVVGGIAWWGVGQNVSETSTGDLNLQPGTPITSSADNLAKNNDSPEKEPQISPNVGQETENQMPEISSFTGPISLMVGKEGTWDADVSDPEGDPLRYIVEWGDEPPAGDLAHPINRVAEGFATEYPSSTFTHVYEQAGTYTITLTVLDSDLTRGTTEEISIKVSK
jgi:hypothetical protein